MTPRHSLCCRAFLRVAYHATHRSVRRAALVAVLLPAISCRSSTAPSDGLPLPLALAVRSDTPYITGVVASVEAREEATLRVLVRVRDANVSAARVAAALVSIAPDSLLLWRDGRRARPQDLVVGRAVTVWVRGAELRSLPPQVTGSALLLDR